MADRLEGHMEAKKHAYRQTQDGIVISFVVHPDDSDAAFAVCPLGTRFQLAYAEIIDEQEEHGQAVPQEPPKREHRSWDELPAAQQAGIRCEDLEFRQWLQKAVPTAQELFGGDHPAAETAARLVRALCGVESRAELATNEEAATRWYELDAQYQTDTGRTTEKR